LDEISKNGVLKAGGTMKDKKSWEHTLKKISGQDTMVIGFVLAASEEMNIFVILCYK